MSFHLYQGISGYSGITFLRGGHTTIFFKNTTSWVGMGIAMEEINKALITNI